MLRLFRYYLLMTARDCKRVSGARALGRNVGSAASQAVETTLLHQF